MTYGEDCKGSCQEKCHQDCANRVTGACLQAQAKGNFELGVNIFIERVRHCVNVEVTKQCALAIFALVAFVALGLTLVWHCIWRCYYVVFPRPSVPSTFAPSEVSAIGELLGSIGLSSSDSGDGDPSTVIAHKHGASQLPPVFVPWAPQQF
ncbi:hypothetical protein RRG08_011118 [Elysia crispata]|uniref:Transmembrane protein n=1 Tax=Elysia crispata TaxID=231223 RepID=A0AAE1A0J9_9GAST|nr:hypothetical protein RRG08_011118 [Elysia crispata]